jgi:hypothetical protein
MFAGPVAVSGLRLCAKVFLMGFLFSFEICAEPTALAVAASAVTSRVGERFKVLVRDFGRRVEGLAGAPMFMAINATAHQLPSVKGDFIDVQLRDSSGKALGFVVGDDCARVLDLMGDGHLGYKVTFTNLPFAKDPRNRHKHVGGPFAEFVVTSDAQ